MVADTFGFTKSTFKEIHWFGVVLLLFIALGAAMASTGPEQSRALPAQFAVGAFVVLMFKYMSLMFAAQKQRRWLQALIDEIPAGAQAQEACSWACKRCDGSGTEHVSLADNKGAVVLACEACLGRASSQPR